VVALSPAMVARKPASHYFDHYGCDYNLLAGALDNRRLPSLNTQCPWPATHLDSNDLHLFLGFQRILFLAFCIFDAFSVSGFLFLVYIDGMAV